MHVEHGMTCGEEVQTRVTVFRVSELFTEIAHDMQATICCDIETDVLFHRRTLSHLLFLRTHSVHDSVGRGRFVPFLDARLSLAEVDSSGEAGPLLSTRGEPMYPPPMPALPLVLASGW